jgi:hypothetical protein
MGERICGVILLEFKITDYDIEQYKKYYPTNYFDFYDRDTREAKKSNLYKIKLDMFMPHYGDLLIEFYNAIGEDLLITEAEDLSEKKFTLKRELLEIKEFKPFKKSFSYTSRDGTIPLIVEEPSIMAFDSRSAWLFYIGSEAYLEEYSTLTHLECALVRLMKNPLAPIIRLGIIG